MSNANLPGTTCPAPMTRAALITLRNAGGLSKDCDYVITDHVQGRLVAGTILHLQAVDANTLSENVSVKTTYDNEAWQGLYNIDTGIVFYLADNFGNTVRGTQDVTAFDWGNPSYLRNTINGSSITYTYGNTATVQYLNATNATINLTGYTGTIDHMDVVGSTVTLTGSALKFFRCNFAYGTNANLTGMTDTGTLSRWVFNSSAIDFRNSTTVISTLSNVRTNNITWNMANVTGGAFVGSGLDISNSTLNFLNGMGTFSVTNNSTIESGSIINFSAGNLTITRTTVASGSTVQASGSNTSMLFSSSHVKSAQLINNGAGALQFINADMAGSATLNIAAGSSCALTIRNTRLAEAAGITVSATAIGNAVTFSGCSIGSAQSVSISGTRSFTSNNSRFNDSTITLSGSGAVTDIMNNSTMNSGCALTLSNSGAQNTFDRITMYGLGATYVISGTSGGGTYSRMSLLDGRYLENNIATAKTITSMRMLNTGFLSMTQAPAGYTLTNSTVEDGATLSVNKTAVGNSTYISIKRGTLNIRANAGSVADVIIETGTVTINAGSINRLTKTMNSTLTINGGVQDNVHHLTTASKTTTVNNTNRADYLGLVSSAPIL